ncbi:MAG: TonB-dependent receptor [Marinilabiliaceae bacterium]|nr:TonB-dependent receptor [Marinilabiliaceae bacterium]
MKIKTLIATLLLSCTVAFAQQKVEVSGRVIDDTGAPVAGAAIVIKGTSQGTVTDLDGNYTISVAPDAVLAITMLGYVNQEIPVDGQTKIDFNLEADWLDLDDIVVVGYGTQKKSDITTSIVSVKGEDLRKETQGNVATALQGKAAGVQVISNNGAPGGTPTVLVRGFTTINSSTSPLYVVDGVPIVNTDGNGNINFLSSEDIESIDILKDASAAAIYGTRASAGVIIITTKRGKVGDTQYNVNFTYGIQHVKKPYNVLNKAGYIEAMNTAYKNSGAGQLIDEATAKDLADTDWWSLGIRDFAPEINASISMNGGDEKHQYNAAFSYFRQESFYNVGNWERFTLRVNNDWKLTEWLKLGADLNPRHEKWDNTPNWYGDYLQIDPTTAPKKSADQLNGTENEYSIYSRSKYTYTWNPVARESRQDGNGGKNYGITANGYVNVTPIEGLSIRSQISANYNQEMTKSFNPEFVIDASHEFNAVTNVDRKTVTDFNWSWQNTAQYDLNIEEHHGSVMVGMTAEEQNREYLQGYREGYPSTIETMRQLDGSNGTVQKASGNEYTNSIVSYIGRLTYNYDDRYLITATGRYDGSSKFLDKNKWAFFPSFSAAWRFSREAFLIDNEIISDAKLIAGWGNVGNQNLPSDVYLSKLGTDYYSFDSENVSSVTGMSTMKNEDIKWEIIEELNVGVEVGLFQQQLTASVELYKKTTKDMLFQMTYPYYAGFPSWGNIWTNIGDMEAKGIDFAVNYRNTFDKLRVDLNFNMSTAKMKMNKLAGTEEILGHGWNDQQTTRMVIGDEPGYFYGFKTAGLFQNETEVRSYTNEYGEFLQQYARPGDIRFVDVNNDGAINADDRVKIGSPFPDFTGGFNANLSYELDNAGTVDFGLNLYFSYGNDVVNWLIIDKYNAASQTNLASDALGKCWHGEGTSNYLPILSHNDNNGNYTKFSDFFVEDASYLRLKDIQVGYSLSQPVCAKLHINSARFSVSAQNLHTWTKFTGVDPETNFAPMEYGFQEFAYPMQRTWLFGLNVTF